MCNASRPVGTVLVFAANTAGEPAQALYEHCSRELCICGTRMTHSSTYIQFTYQNVTHSCNDACVRVYTYTYHIHTHKYRYNTVSIMLIHTYIHTYVQTHTCFNASNTTENPMSLSAVAPQTVLLTWCRLNPGCPETARCHPPGVCASSPWRGLGFRVSCFLTQAWFISVS